MAKFCGVGVGVGVVCLDQQGRLLIGRRKGSHGAGTFALPGGHLELNETWEECARREVLEETGLELEQGTMEHCFTSNNRMENDKHYITVVMVGRIKAGCEPQNLEPNKCQGWEFHEWRELQRSTLPMFMPLRMLLDGSDSAPWVKPRNGRRAGEYLAAAAVGAAVACLVSGALKPRR